MKEKGYFLVMMFFIMVVLSALAAAYSSFTIKQLTYAKKLENDILLRQIAENGLKYAKFNLRNNATFRRTRQPIASGRGEFSVTISPSESYYIIKSSAKLGELEKILEYKYLKKQ